MHYQSSPTNPFLFVLVVRSRNRLKLALPDDEIYGYASAKQIEHASDIDSLRNTERQYVKSSVCVSVSVSDLRSFFVLNKADCKCAANAPVDPSHGEKGLFELDKYFFIKKILN